MTDLSDSKESSSSLMGKKSSNWLIVWSITAILVSRYLFGLQSVVDMAQRLPGYYRNPDTGRDIFELIQSRGFRYESHHVQTKDGYILNLVRVVNPYKQNRHHIKEDNGTTIAVSASRPVLLMHGFMCTGMVWLTSNNGTLDQYGNYIEYEDDEIDGHRIINGTEVVANTLGFVLASRGYDVWIANNRGSTYSNKHIVYNVDSEKFWHFSMDEMIHIDLPATIDYILSVTGHESLSFVGHSQGATLGIALASISDQYADRMKPVIALGAAWYNVNLTSTLALASTGGIYQHITRIYAGPAPFANMAAISRVLANVCSNYLLRVVCHSIYDGFVGFRRKNINLDRLPVYLANVPAGVSAWNVAQMLQTMDTGRPVEHFDYGDEEKNRHIYGQTRPPVYDAGRINSTNLALFYAESDIITPIDGVKLLKQDLKVPLLDDYLVPDQSWDHMNFVWGKSVGKLINQRVLQLLARFI